MSHGPLARYVTLRVAHAPGMPGTFSPPPRVSDPEMHRGTRVTHVSWCMPGSLTSGFLWSWWRGKHSRRMRKPQFSVSGKMSNAHTQNALLSDTFEVIAIVDESNSSEFFIFVLKKFGDEPFKRGTVEREFECSRQPKLSTLPQELLWWQWSCIIRISFYQPYIDMVPHSVLCSFRRTRKMSCRRLRRSLCVNC